MFRPSQNSSVWRGLTRIGFRWTSIMYVHIKVGITNIHNKNNNVNNNNINNKKNNTIMIMVITILEIYK